MRPPDPNTAGATARQLHQQGRLQQAEALYRQALQSADVDRGLLRDHGVVLVQLGRHAEAEQQLAAIPRNDPLWLQAAAPLAVSLRSQGKLSQALQIAQQLTERDPRQLQGQWLHACLLVQAGHHAAGVERLQALLREQPWHLEGQHFLGVGQQALGNLHAAIQAYHHVAAHHPGAWYNIAQCAELAGDLPLAVQGYQQLAGRPQPRADVLARLAHAQAQLGLLDAATQTTSRLSQCLQQPQLLDASDIPEPFVCCARNLPSTQYQWILERYAQRIRQTVSETLAAPARWDGTRPWRIGYLSADFGGHAVGHLLHGLFEQHDRQQVQVYAYSLQSSPGSHEQSLLAKADHARSLAPFTDREAALQIQQDGIDVLVDLSGYTHGARPGIAAHRPATLQLGWLGFISPQQADWLDGLLLDRDIAPDAAAWPYCDRIVHLPRGMLPATVDAEPIPAIRADYGLDDNDIVLLACHTTYKLDQPLMQAWSALISATPRARLLLIAAASSHRGLRDSWQAAGGDLERLHLLGNQPRATYLRLLACADLLLDAFAYGAGATAMDACQASLPILTLAGRNPWQRMAASLNRRLGLTELICDSPAQYIQQGQALCHQPHILARLRQRLRMARQQNTLFDPRRSAQDLEDLCRQWLLHGAHA